MTRGLLRQWPSALLVTALVALSTGHWLLHLGVSTVLSQSMSPTFDRGDLIVTRLVDVADLRVGDVPVLVPPDGTTPYVHRISALRTGAGTTSVTTRGDANPVADTWVGQLTARQVPVVVGLLPGVGQPGLLVRGQRGQALLVTLIGLLTTSLAVRMILHVPVPPVLTEHALNAPVPAKRSFL